MPSMRGSLVAAAAVLAAGVVVSGQAPGQVSMVITNGIVVTADAGSRVISPGAVAIDGADIVAVDGADAIRRQFCARETIDAGGQAVMPGLVNTHTHAPRGLFRGLADDLANEEWRSKNVVPPEARTLF